jgi:catechol 2,3-dioxygenase
MSSTNDSTNLPFATRTPLHIGAVGITVRDLDQALGFYHNVVGLSVLERAEHAARLGVGDVVLVELTHQPEVQSDDPHTPGLYHVAFVMPTRADLARWMLHMSGADVPIIGANDHGVCEAFYLNDPEGNGVEIYADRPAETWRWSEGQVLMPSKPLDIEYLLRAADAVANETTPADLRVGHVHLRVGDLSAAEAFYHGALGLDLTRRRAGASFMSSGGYHHHVATNVWDSSGAGPRDQHRAGLSWFSIVANDSATQQPIASRLRELGAPVTPIRTGFETADPWGTRIRFMAA